MSSDQQNDCRRFEGLLAASVDGELEPAEQTILEAHLALCARCRGELASQAQIKDLIGTRTPRPVAPLALKERILRLIEEEAHPVPAREVSWLRRLLTRPVPAWATALLLLLASLFLVTNRTGGPEMGLAVQEAVANHVHMLQGHYLPMEVQSDDPAEVSAWLSKNLSQPTPVPRLPVENVSLVGGRMCHLGGQPAGYACYVWRGRLLGLFVAQRGALALDRSVREQMAMQGYARFSYDQSEILFWEDGENDFLLVAEGEAVGALDELTAASWRETG